MAGKENLASVSTIGVLFKKHLELTVKICSFKSSALMYAVKDCRLLTDSMCPVKKHLHNTFRIKYCGK